MGLAFTLDAKGAEGLVRRMGTIVSRFGPTPGPMERRLTLYSQLVGEFGAQPTLPVTARVLARYPDVFRHGTVLGIEFAAHGLVHNDHAVAGIEAQQSSMAESVRLFREAGVPCRGFRGPYLRFNDSTRQAVRAAGLAYHSSQAVAYSVIEPESLLGGGSDVFARALRLYRAVPAEDLAVRPRDLDGLIDIPVSLPDDEIMVDRLSLPVAAQTRAWLAMLADTYWHGDLFTVQLHPERICDCAAALRALLAEARRQAPGVWIARLDQIADWWRRRRAGSLHVRQVEEGGFQVEVVGVPDATLLVRGAYVRNGEPWFGDDRRIASSVTLDTERKPVVGLPPASSPVLKSFLREEGFVCEESEDRLRFGAYLDIAGDAFHERAVLAALDRCEGPLVRLWRWPDGYRSAISVTGDIDSITVQDFALRLWETR